jgi:aspartyl-tRNA synthetase
MAWATGEDVMQRVESLVKSVYTEFTASKIPRLATLPDSPFQRMSYNDAMSRHGSDKPDLRIKGLV